MHSFSKVVQGLAIGTLRILCHGTLSFERKEIGISILCSADEVRNNSCSNLTEHDAVSAISKRKISVRFFGDAPEYPGYFQVNFRVPTGLASGSAVAVRLTYLGRPSNAVTIGVQ